MTNLYAAGWLIDANGVAQTHEIGSTAVPSTANFIAGSAYDSDGRRYTQTLTGAVPADAVYVNGIAHRPDGATYVRFDAPSETTMLNGALISYDGALCVSDGPSATPVFLRGISHSPDGRVSVSSSASMVTAQSKVFDILANGTTGKTFRTVVIGDSITEGATTTTKPDRYIEKLAENLRAGLGFDSKPNSKYVSANYLVQTEVFTYDGTNTPGLAFGLGLRNNSLGAAGNATLVFTGTGADLLFTSAFSTGTGEYTVDGGDPVAIDTDLGAANSDIRIKPQVVEIRGLDSEEHTVVITATDSLILGGAYVYDGDEDEGVHVFEAGHPGFGFFNYAELYIFASGNQVHALTLDPDLLIVPLGANDYLAARSLADAANLMRRTIHLLRATNPSVSIMFVMFQNITDGAVSSDSYASWSAGLKAVAYDLNCAVIDWTDSIGSFVPAGNPNDAGDQIHPNDDGHELIAEQMANKILAVSPTSSFPAYVDPPDLLLAPDLSLWTANGAVVAAASTMADGSPTYTVADDSAVASESIRTALPTLLANGKYRLTVHVRATGFTIAGGNGGPVLQMFDGSANLIQIFHTVQTIIAARSSVGTSAGLGVSIDSFAGGLMQSQIDPDFAEMFLEFEVGAANKSGLFVYLYPAAGAVSRTGTFEFGKPRLQKIS